MNQVELKSETPQTTTCGLGHTITLVVSGPGLKESEADLEAEPPSAPESKS